MAKLPPLTVAIPTFNGARHLRAALRSILAQRGPEFDLVVCDDRSEDETVEIVNEVAGDRARVEINPERLGLAGNWNRCMAVSRTPWVALFHQDDEMRPGHLALHGAIIAQHVLDLGLIAGTAEVIDDEGRPVPEKVVARGKVHLPPTRLPIPAAVPGTPPPHVALFPAGTFVRELAGGNPVRCSAVTIAKTAHGLAGGFDPAWRYAVDWDFWLRAARRAAVAWIARPATVAVRWHAGSETFRFRSGTEDLEEEAALLRHLAREDRDGKLGVRARLPHARRDLARAYLNRAYEAARAGDGPLCRLALRRALFLDPRVAGRIALDPRLAARLSVGVIAGPPVEDEDQDEDVEA